MDESETHVDLERLIYHQTIKSSSFIHEMLSQRNLKCSQTRYFFFPKDFELQSAM